MSKTTILAACGALMLTAVQAMGAVVISHSGSNDPTTESPAWALSAGGTGVAGTGVTHLSEATWKTTDPVGGGSWSMYTAALTAADFDDPTGWTFEWRMAAQNLKTSGSDEASIRVIDGTYWIQLHLFANGAGAGDNATLRHSSGTALKSDIATIASRETGYHTYALDFDPNTNVYRVFVDGSFVTDSSLTPSLLSLSNTSTSIQWGGRGGDEGDPRDVDSFWSSVVLRTGTVPEPSGLALLFAAAVPMLRRKR